MAPSGLRQLTPKDPENWVVSMSGVNGTTGITCTQVACAIGAVTSGMTIGLDFDIFAPFARCITRATPPVASLLPAMSRWVAARAAPVGNL